MTESEKRAAVVAMGKSREKKNQYTQGDKRDQVGSGWSDCSSFVRWCYLKVVGVDIGGNTAAQIVNVKLAVVDGGGGKYPSEGKLLPGDLLYFKGTDKSRPYMVGHVEMYIGGGKLIGHGSGVGPTVKDMVSYCTGRHQSGKGYIRTLRVIGEAETAVMKIENGVKITGGSVNLRCGPGTEYVVFSEAKKGEVFEEALNILAGNGWYPIALDKRVLWVSPNMAERVK